jgi:nitrogen fixation/metabolism regulation signal transduction histidine kinase
LQEQTGRIAAGDFTTRLDVRSHDELGELARSFDRMVQELGESRSKLIKAEKDAAWREMARQVAHEIKNPLTPISLSATLLERAQDEKSPSSTRSSSARWA